MRAFSLSISGARRRKAHEAALPDAIMAYETLCLRHAEELLGLGYKETNHLRDLIRDFDLGPRKDQTRIDQIDETCAEILGDRTIEALSEREQARLRRLQYERAIREESGKNNLPSLRIRSQRQQKAQVFSTTPYNLT
ncbi:MAG: hypothetical protein KGI97_03605 [Alphaproteobacteria bacterium]|nr:hypothetical protein [Alphaproteobacteria bacterium]